MWFRTLCIALLLLAASRGASAPPPATPPDYSQVEIRGAIGSGSEWDPEKVPFKNPPIRAFLTIKVKGQGEWELILDESAEKVLSKSMGKQVTITGSLQDKAIRVKTVNGLELK
jgi:hypothetical protein